MPDATDMPSGIEEASGIARHGDELLIVGDEGASRCYRCPVSGDEKGVVALDEDRLLMETWTASSLPLDLEGVEVLADGRTVVLSERLHALLDREGVVAEYPKLASEFGNRGLEGVAVRPLEDGISRVAVLWEGGYPLYRALPEAYRGPTGRPPMRPMLFIHNVAPGERNLVYEEEDLVIIDLDVPLPGGTPPRAQRFRAPDLVWYRFGGESSGEWGFIVLLSSEYALPPEPGSAGDCPGGLSGERYCYKWLMRFDASGRPVGEPADLDRLIPDHLASRNWEGMDWFVEGESLVLVYEERADRRGNVAIIDLPATW